MTVGWFDAASTYATEDEVILNAMRAEAPRWTEFGITPDRTEAFTHGAGIILGIHVAPFATPDQVNASLYVGYLSAARPGDRVVVEWDFSGYILDGAPALQSSLAAGQDEDPLSCASGAIALLTAQLRRPLYVDRWHRRTRDSQVWRLEEPHVEVKNVGYSLAQFRRRGPDSTERIR